MLFTNILVALAAAAFATAQLEDTLGGDALDFACAEDCVTEIYTAAGCNENSSNDDRADLAECVRSQCDTDVAEAFTYIQDEIGCNRAFSIVASASVLATDAPAVSASGSGGGPSESITTDNDEDGSATSVKAVWGSIAVAALAALVL